MATIKDEYCITEIVCLKSKVLKTGRSRVIRAGEVDGEVWDRLVEAAIKKPEHFEIHRDLARSIEDATKDIDAVSIGRMFNLPRETVAEYAGYYGIPDTGQTRAALIDQIKAERQRQAKLIADEAEGNK